MLIYQAEITSNCQLRELYAILTENLGAIAITYFNKKKIKWVVNTQRKAFLVKDYCKRNYRNGSLRLEVQNEQRQRASSH